MVKLQKKYRKPSLKSSSVKPVRFYGRGSSAQAADSEMNLLAGVIS
jgi:hypothetical protein